MTTAAPKRARVDRLKRGLSIEVTVGQAGSKISAVLRLRGRTVARGRAAGKAGSAVTVRLKRTRAGTRRLARLHRRARAKLRVTVTSPGGAKARATASIELRP